MPIGSNPQLIGIDETSFCKIFELLSPWEQGECTSLLAEWLFHFMDTTSEGNVTFYLFVQTLGVLLRGDLKRRLLLLYQLHVLQSCDVTDKVLDTTEGVSQGEGERGMEVGKGKRQGGRGRRGGGGEDNSIFLPFIRLIAHMSCFVPRIVM